MINLDADEEIGEEMATEKELQEAATAQNELQEADTAEKPEEPAKVAKEAEVETMEATQPNEMLAKAETKKGIVPQSTSAALGPVLPSANVVKVETNGVPQGQIEIFSIFAAQGPIISTSMVQDLDSSSDSDFEEVPSLPPLDEEKHSPKGSKRRHGKAKEGEPSPKKQKTQDKSKTYRVTDGV
ncbi:hypothetical protein KR018_003003 [Drosophila ironensis]|nr:hypothetical protein KR018_003003 [Drosophila ironensis]